MNASLVPLHLGSLHPVEQLLVYALAFGPFLVLGAVVLVRRHQNRRADSDQPDQDRRDR
jgi:hypothetical protein